MISKTRRLTYTSVLTALAIIIPLIFGPFKVVIGPFTATLTAHVPMFLSMFLGPLPALMVGLGSALGFFVTSGPIVGGRALMHSVVGIIGAILIKKGVSFRNVIMITAPIHAILEALVVLGFISIGMIPKYTGNLAYYIVMAVAVGTILHHSVDGIITSALLKFMPAEYKLNKLNRINSK